MSSRVTAIHPPCAIEGGRLILEGVFPAGGPPPDVRIGGERARVVRASSSSIAVLVPSGLVESRQTEVRVEGVAGDPVFLEIAAPLATGLHQVDNPAFDRAGNLFVTYSGTRGQQVPVSIFRVRPDGTRETFSSGVVNPTSLACGPDDALYVSSRFEGTVYRVAADGTVEAFATNLGVACGLTFASDGTLFVGDRSGTIFKLDSSGKAETFASLPSSVAAFHLAFGPDDALYVSAPTLGSYDSIYRIDLHGTITTVYNGFGRPQGLAFDAGGTLVAVEALAGASGLYRFTTGGAPELIVAAPGLVGVAFDGLGGAVVCSNDTAYRIARVRW
jgi:sugar lactone lactonase YvrE